MWTISEIADKIMKYSSLSNRSDETETFDNVELPEKYFQKQSADFSNDKIYLCKEFLNNIFQTNNSSNVSSKFNNIFSCKLFNQFQFTVISQEKPLKFHKFR